MGQTAIRPTVLIADADESFRKLVRRHLGEGVNVVGEAANGEEAMALAGEMEPDVILMDIALPVVDGLAATRWIKTQRPETRVVLLTNHKEEAYLSATGKSGADAFLPKKQVRSAVLAMVRAAARGFAGGWDGRERRGQEQQDEWDGGERRGRGVPLNLRGAG